MHNRIYTRDMGKKGRTAEGWWCTYKRGGLVPSRAGWGRGVSHLRGGGRGSVGGRGRGRGGVAVFDVGGRC